MGTFIGAEYLIANVLIELKRNGIDRISTQELREYGGSVQKRCLSENLDAVFLVSSDSVGSAIYNFSDYFSLGEEGGTEYISINNSMPVEDVKKRFMGYIDPDVLVILIEQAVSAVEEIAKELAQA